GSLYYRRRPIAEKLLDHLPMQLERDFRVGVADDALAGLVGRRQRRQLGGRARPSQPEYQDHAFGRAEHAEITDLLWIDRDAGLLEHLARAGLLPALAQV